MIAPSMLKCDFGALRDDTAAVARAGADLIHWDVMDGGFVPNLSYGAMVIESTRQCTDLAFEAHLMMSQPDEYLDGFLDAGCDAVTFHVETDVDASALLKRIRSAGAAAGIALNPGTPVDRVLPLLGECDLVLVMSVEPGFGGQKFQPSSLPKLQALQQVIPTGCRLSVDGGIGPATIAEVSAAGASMFVVGSALFEADDYNTAIGKLRQLADGAGK